MKLLVATTNEGKLAELRNLLGPAELTLLTLKDLRDYEEVEETGTTFAENAQLKAAGYARNAGMWSLADDSGLEVAALGGRPGVGSARFAGRDAGYDVKIAKLFEMMQASGDPDRSARFVCAMALADDEGNICFNAEGVCPGRIADRPRGTNGFGYDPVFIPDGHDLTFGELPDRVKHSISHRSRAAIAVVRYLLDFIAV